MYEYERRGQRIAEAKRRLTERYPDAADDIESMWIDREEQLVNLERYAASRPIREEREREARESARSPVAGRKAREREENRARCEYGLPFSRDAYTPPGEERDG